MKSIANLFPFENYADLDAPRKLRWNNKAIMQAILYYRAIFGEQTTELELISGAITGKYPCIVALLYGALNAAEGVGLPEFGRIFRPENAAQYLIAAREGIQNYLPPPETEDAGADLDEEWPDTQSEVKKKSPQAKGLRTGSGQPKVNSGSGSTKSKNRH